MGSIAILTFVLLSSTACSLVQCAMSSNQTLLEAVIAEQKAMAVTLNATKARLEATETKFYATETRLEATETKLEGIETELQATKTELESTETELEGIETELQATNARLEASETRLEATETRLQATKTRLQATETKLEATEIKLEATENKLEATTAKLQNTTAELKAFRAAESKRFKSGSSFIRWGRKSCPGKTTLVYSGIAGGKFQEHKGSGTNFLCLTRTPRFDKTKKPSHVGVLYGAEYETIPGHHNYKAPCSVCLAPQSTTIMVTGTSSCPSGWTAQYTGHLASQYYGHPATEYVCLDGNLENDSSDHNDNNGVLFYYVITACGSLPCPPYIHDKVVTCVVCSK